MIETTNHRPMRLLPLLRAIEAGTSTPEATIRDALARIGALDAEIGAFLRLAPRTTIEAAIGARGPLRGVPLGVKDIYDTADMATEHGSPIYAGNRPRADAALVVMARMRGAFIAGKTTTTEFAHMTPTATRNPAAPGHTPGGSSSGSAAAVAAGLVAGAFGSQTGGSVIRPASFCGVAGYKPSFRLLPTVGMKTYSWSLDTAGLFSADVEGAALLAHLLTGRDLAVGSLSSSSGLRIGLYRSTVDERLEPSMADAVARAAGLLEADGATLVDMAEPADLSAARDAQGTLQDYEAALALAYERITAPDLLSPGLARALAKGADTPPEVYDAARGAARRGRKAATALFDDVDALLLPSALGPAPATLASTGDPLLNKLWTLTGNPCINVPGLATGDGLPLGVTIVTRFGRDREALAIAAQLQHLIETKAA